MYVCVCMRVWTLEGGTDISDAAVDWGAGGVDMKRDSNQ